MENVKNVSVGKPMIGGAVHYAPAGTTLPTSVFSTLPDSYVDVGYISEDGIVNSVSRDTEEIKAWGGDTVAQPQTGKTDTFQMTFIEAKNANVLKAVHGSDNVTGSLETEIVVRENAKELDYGVWIIDMILSNNTLKRMVLPYARITEIGDVTYQDNSVIGYESTMTAFPHAEWDGDTHREYIAEHTESE